MTVQPEDTGAVKRESVWHVPLKLTVDLTQRNAQNVPRIVYQVMEQLRVTALEDSSRLLMQQVPQTNNRSPFIILFTNYVEQHQGVGYVNLSKLIYFYFR